MSGVWCETISSSRGPDAIWFTEFPQVRGTHKLSQAYTWNKKNTKNKLGFRIGELSPIPFSNFNWNISKYYYFSHFIFMQLGLWTMSTQCLWESEEGMKSSKNEVTDACEILREGWELSLGPL